MAKEKIPVTSAVRHLREKGAEFTLCPYAYEEKGGTSTAARELGVEEHQVVKTLVMEDDSAKPLLVLMHGDRSVSTRELARLLGVKTIRPCDPETAHKHTGYVVGGISPFGTRKGLSVYVEASILDLPRIYINAGKRGLLAEISPSVLVSVLKPVSVKVAIP